MALSSNLWPEIRLQTGSAQYQKFTRDYNGFAWKTIVLSLSDKTSMQHAAPKCCLGVRGDSADLFRV